MATEPQKTNLKILFNGSIDSNLSSIIDSESKIKEIQPYCIQYYILFKLIIEKFSSEWYKCLKKYYYYLV